MYQITIELVKLSTDMISYKPMVILFCRLSLLYSEPEFYSFFLDPFKKGSLISLALLWIEEVKPVLLEL